MLNREEVLEKKPEPAPKPRRAPRRPRATGNGIMHSVTPQRFLARLRYQLLFGVLVTVVLPSLAVHYERLEIAWTDPPSIGANVGAIIAFLIALFLFRRVMSLPGVGIVGHVLPALAAGYGIVFAIILGARVDYSRLTFGISFTMAGLFLFLVGTFLRPGRGQLFYLVPSREMKALLATPNVDWIIPREPKLPADTAPVLIA